MLFPSKFSIQKITMHTNDVVEFEVEDSFFLEEFFMDHSRSFQYCFNHDNIDTFRITLEDYHWFLDKVSEYIKKGYYQNFDEVELWMK